MGRTTVVCLSSIRYCHSRPRYGGSNIILWHTVGRKFIDRLTADRLGVDDGRDGIGLRDWRGLIHAAILLQMTVAASVGAALCRKTRL